MSVAVEQIGGNRIENVVDIDKVLLAIGRSPNTEELNLPAVVSAQVKRNSFENMRYSRVSLSGDSIIPVGC